MRRLSPFLFLLSLLLAATSASAEQTWSARHACGSVHRPGSFVPVHVEITNDSADGRSVRVQGEAGDRTSSRRVELPAKSRKALTLYLGPGARQSSVQVQLLDDHENVLGTHDVSSIAAEPGIPVVGILGEHPMGWARLRGERRVRVGHLDTKSLPGRAEGLRALDVLIWPDASPAALRPEQIEAVATWTETGGLLVLPVNDTWLEASLGGLESWTTVRPTGIASRSELPSLTAWGIDPLGPLPEPISVARLGSGAGEVWLQEPWGPVIVSERRGRGRVVLLGFDPTDEPVTRWTGLEGFWRELLRRHGLRVPDAEQRKAPIRGASWNQFNFPFLAQRELSRVEGVEPPPIGLLLLVLLAYLLMIGPVDYFLLRRGKRLAWTWITYPAIVIAFSLGTWVLAQASRSGTALLHHIVLADLHVESGRWVREVHSSLFTVRAGDYTMRYTEGSPLPVPMRSFGRRGGQFVEGFATDVRSEQATGSVTVRQPKWSSMMASFLVSHPSNGAGIQSSLALGEHELIGRIETGLGFDLDDALLIVAIEDELWYFRVGPLRDRTPHSVEPRRGKRLRRGVFRWNESFHNALIEQTVREWISRGTPPDTRSSAERVYLVDQQPHHDWSRFLAGGGAVLIGRAETEPPRVVVEGVTTSQSGTDLYVRVPIPPQNIRREETTATETGS